MSSIDDQINRLERQKKRARTASQRQKIQTQINELKAQKRRGIGVGGGRGEDPRKFGMQNFSILNRNKQSSIPTEKTKQRNRELPAGRYGEYSAKTPSGTGPLLGDPITYDKTEIFKNKGSGSRPDALDAKERTSSDNDLLGGSDPTDRYMNDVEKLVSKLMGRRVRFADIPDDDPDFKQGDGSIEYPAGRPDLRMGGMTARSAATTKFKKPLGMKGGGAISNAERRRIARIMQDYKQKKARKSNGKRTNR
tara:strand:- start:271 stop:1023 length:753 start_codon:yes stop_codon:yes gene_type:complete